MVECAVPMDYYFSVRLVWTAMMCRLDMIVPLQLGHVEVPCDGAVMIGENFEKKSPIILRLFSKPEYGVWTTCHSRLRRCWRVSIQAEVGLTSGF